jgi:hypothetical protein
MRKWYYFTGKNEGLERDIPVTHSMQLRQVDHMQEMVTLFHIITPSLESSVDIHSCSA